VEEQREMVANKGVESWKDQWKSFLDGGVSAEDIVISAIAEYEGILRKIIANWDNQPTAGLGDHRMLGFCEKSRGDLVSLVEAGANPANPLFGKPALDGDDEDGERIKEFDVIAKPEYWKKMVSKLERAREELFELMDSKIFQDIEERQMWSDFELNIYPFARVCKEVRTTEGTIDRLIRSIRELRLNEGSRKLTYNRPCISWEPTEATRGPKSNMGKRLGWDRPAYGLSKYLTVQTEKPHFRQVARFLHFSGWDFPGVITLDEDPDLDTERVGQDEIDKIHKRIKKLEKDPGFKIGIGDLITRLEHRYETRDLRNYGGFITSPLAVIEPELDSNE
jgi:hypothetical protein